MGFEGRDAFADSRPAMQAAPDKARSSGEAGREAFSAVTADMIVLGNVVARGRLDVLGEVRGDVHARMVVVGEEGRVTGAVVGEDVVVLGTVHGGVYGVHVTLLGTSHVEGDLYHQSLTLEPGAMFEGKSRRTDNPLVNAPLPEPEMS